MLEESMNSMASGMSRASNATADELLGQLDDEMDNDEEILQ